MGSTCDVLVCWALLFGNNSSCSAISNGGVSSYGINLNYGNLFSYDNSGVSSYRIGLGLLVSTAAREH